VKTVVTVTTVFHKRLIECQSLKDCASRTYFHAYLFYLMLFGLNFVWRSDYETFYLRICLLDFSPPYCIRESDRNRRVYLNLEPQTGSSRIGERM